MKRIISAFTALAVLFSAFSFCALAANESVLDGLTAERLVNNLPSLVTDNLTLPTSVDGVPVTWVSSDEGVIALDGTVTRDTYDEKPVILTASAAGAKKAFNFTVAPMTSNVIYQDAFYYPDWKGKDFLTADTGNKIGWSKLWSSSNNHRIDTIKRDNEDNYVLAKNGDITERTIYSLPKSPDTVTVSFDIYYNVADTDSAIYDYDFHLDNDTYFYLRHSLNTSGSEMRLYNTQNTSVVSSSKADLNLRKQWFTLSFELDQSNSKLTLKVNGNAVFSDSIYTNNPTARLSKLYFQPGSQGTCKPLYLDNIALVEYKSPETYANEVAVETLLDRIDVDTFTTQSSYAVTNNLNLSSDSLAGLLEETGAELSFASSNPSVLSVESGVGVITPQISEETVTLTATASKGGFSKQKSFSLTVPSKNAYVYESEGFGHPELKNDWLSKLERWSGAEDENGFYSKITEDGGAYRITSKRDNSTSSYNYYTHTFDGLRKTETVSVELTVTYKELSTAGDFYYDFEFYGKDENGNADNSNRIGYVRINANAIYSYYNASSSYSKARAATNGSNRLRLDFDFKNQCYDLYVDGVKANTSAMPFPASTKYAAIDFFRFTAFRTMTGAHFQIDDFVVKSDTPAFTSDYFDDTYNRPLTLSVGKYNNQPCFNITSAYSADENLRQSFLLLHDGSSEHNVHFDFYGAYLVNKQTSAEKCLLEKVISDETAPLIINGLYLGANHGAVGVRLTAANHGKTTADIGSLWTDTSNQDWTLLRVIDENTLLFLAEITCDLSSEAFSFPSKIMGNSLTYKESGASTSNIVFTAQEGSQVYPSVANVSPSVYTVRDNVKSAPLSLYTAAQISCDEVILEISYDIMNPALIGKTLRENRPEGGYTSSPSLAVGEKMVHYTLRMTIDESGTVFTNFDHEILTELYSMEYYGYQFYPRADVYQGGVYRYLPGTKEFSATASDNTVKTFDFSVPFNTASDFPLSTDLKSEQWANPDSYVPDRIIDYYKNTSGKIAAAYATGFLPTDDAAPDKRKGNTTESVFLYKSKKAYPIFINNAAFAKKDAHIRGTAYRKYEDLSSQTGDATVYSATYDNKVYFYIDFFAETSTALDLSAKYNIANPEIVYKSTDAVCTLLGDTALLSGQAKDYVVICADRSIEMTNAVYDSLTQTATVRIVNPSQGVGATLIAAAYSGKNKMARMAQAPVTLVENSVTLQKANIALSSDETLVFFLLKDDGSLMPLCPSKALYD